ncbi:MAG TPA: hypothetical protein VHM23_16225 [Actinomycetota bacterium]|jgi:hypothetical protein|nr:hypothetical protein [Actinomycetota bacterium]
MLSMTYQVARARQAELLAQAEQAREQRAARRRLRQSRRAKR